MMIMGFFLLGIINDVIGYAWILYDLIGIYMLNMVGYYRYYTI